MQSAKSTLPGDSITQRLHSKALGQRLSKRFSFLMRLSFRVEYFCPEEVRAGTGLCCPVPADVPGVLRAPPPGFGCRRDPGSALGAEQRGRTRGGGAGAPAAPPVRDERVERVLRTPEPPPGPPPPSLPAPGR